eukprot:5444196-Amphidinium_carterae.1
MVSVMTINGAVVFNSSGNVGERPTCLPALESYLLANFPRIATLSLGVESSLAIASDPLNSGQTRRERMNVCQSASIHNHSNDGKLQCSKH